MSSAKTLIAQATRDNANPPPGYQLSLLTKASISSISITQEIESALLKRLNSRSSNVKWKSLKIVKHMCMTGHSNFKRSFQRHTDILRNCITFTGASHPLHGDMHNERVRTAAKEAMNAVFSTATTETRAAASEWQSKITGFGNSDTHLPTNDSDRKEMNSSERISHDNSSYNISSSTSSYGSTESGSRSITGFGNPAFQNQSSTPSMMDRVKKVFEPIAGRHSLPSLTNSHSPYNSYGSHHHHHHHHQQQQKISHTHQFSAPTNTFDVKPAHAQHSGRQRGQVGGGWGINMSTAQQQNTSEESWTPNTLSSPNFESNQTNNFVQKSISKASDGILERRLVKNATASGGIKTTPTKTQIDEIMSSYSSLDVALFLSLLNDQLSCSNWQSQLKALHVVEALMTLDIEYIQEFFLENPRDINTLISSTTRSVRVKANHITSELGLSQAPQVDGNIRASNDENIITDLLDLSAINTDNTSSSSVSSRKKNLNSSSIPHSTQQMSAQNTSSSSSSSNLFSVLNTRRNQEISSSTNDTNPLDFLMSSTPLVHDTNTSRPISFDPLDDTVAAPSQNNATQFFSQPSAFTFLSGSNAVATPHIAKHEQASMNQNNGEYVVNNEKKILDAQSKSSWTTKSMQESTSSRAMDPFASAVKPTRKSNGAKASRADSFAFVQDMMHDKA